MINFKDCKPTLPGPSKQAFLKFIYLLHVSAAKMKCAVGLVFIL